MNSATKSVLGLRVLKSLLFPSLLYCLGCSQTPSIAANADGVATFGVVGFNANAYKINNLICEGDAPTPQNGLKATLYYKEISTGTINTVTSLESQYKKSSQNLFFTDLNTPTRLFTEGFTTPTGEKVKDDVGTMLVENFGLVFESELKLKATDEEGNYEFMLLADDGAIVEMQGLDGNWRTVVNNDGDHPTQAGCSVDSANKTVSLVAQESYPIRVKYYQGPRYHIANVLMWRKVLPGRDVACGQQGNNIFFDPNNGSQIMPLFTGILGRGWKVIPPENYFLPMSALNHDQTFNPCNMAEAPVITDFGIGEVFPTSVIIRWHTDVPATSQVVVKNAAGVTQQLTTSDNVLRMDHSVTVNGLSFSTAYQAQAVSYGANQGMAVSPTVSFTTP